MPNWTELNASCRRESPLSALTRYLNYTTISTDSVSPVCISCDRFSSHSRPGSWDLNPPPTSRPLQIHDPRGIQNLGHLLESGTWNLLG